MSFFPNQGHWSEESFSSTSGVVFGNSQLQNVVGGFVTLVPQNTSTVFYNTVWAPFTGWHVQNRLFARRAITGDFHVSGALESPYQAATPSGFQQSYVSAGAWEIFTPYPGASGSGTYNQYLELRNVSSNYWFQYFDNGGEVATLEFDVACTFDPYSGLTTLQGFTTGTENQTELSAISGVPSHGIYIKTKENYEFVEVLPYGIRLLHHPEIAIPIDLTTPKRIRIGVDDQDIYLTTEDGRSVVGFSAIDSVSENLTPILAIGAPPLSGGFYEWNIAGLSGFAGHTYWSNFKLVTNTLALNEAQNQSQYYSTSPVTLYTDVFNPNRRISNYVSATVGFIPYKGGTTTITAQYSGVTGFVDSSATITLNGNSISPNNIDLSSIPIYTFPRANQSENIVYNPIRFKITQVSNNGSGLAPAIDYLRIYTSFNRTYLDLLPNWRPITQPVNVKLSIVSGDFLTSDPEVGPWTDALLNVPPTIGVKTGALTDDSNSLSFTIIGTGEIQQGGRFGYQFNNFIYTSGRAVTGSAAAALLGTDFISNFFPNPLLTEEFVPVNGVTGFISGKTFGYLAPGLDFPTNFTGRSSVTYNKVSVIRPELQARQDRILGVIGSQNLDTNYVQNITIPSFSTGGIHDGTVGVEIIVPSGIAGGTMLAELDLQISDGSGLNLYVTGATTTRNWSITGEQFRVYRQVSFPFTATSSGEIRFGLVVPSGSSLDQQTIYNIDNITVSPINTSYLTVTGISCEIHRTGTLLQGHVISALKDISRATTVFSTDAYIYTYPQSTGVLVECTGLGNKGFTIFMNSEGFLTGSFNRETDAMSAGVGSPGFTRSLGAQTFGTNLKVPLGQLINIGFIHQSFCYDQFSSATYSGALVPDNFASSNRVYITINGQPIYSADAARDWWHANVIDGVSNDSAPLSYYIPLSGNVRMTLFSGLYGYFDAVKLDRPAVGDAEIELSIKAARACAPYFVPDVLLNSTITLPNPLYDTYNSVSAPTFGKQPFMGSIYNFSSPGFTNWDHGPLRNHLVYYGNVSKLNHSPYSNTTYSGIGSTFFPRGSYGIATYSSAMDRWFNTENDLNISSFLDSDGLNAGAIDSKGWLYPYTTGDFFFILKDGSNITGTRLTLGISAVNRLILTKYSGQTVQYINTGQPLTMSGWNYLGAKILIGGEAQTSTATRFISGAGAGDVITNTATGFPMRYQGNTGDAFSSAFAFGYGADVAFSDWSIGIIPQASPTTIGSFYSGLKSGRYQALMEDYEIFEGTVSWNSFTEGVFTLETGVEAQSRFFWVAGHNAIDSLPRLNDGILLYDDKLFNDIASYNLTYNPNALYNKFGDINSPIKIGNVVPNRAINLAKIDGQSFDVFGSINTIDLSDSNLNNFTTYKDGEYSVARNGGSIVPTSGTTINHNNLVTLSGRADVTYSGQIVSNNIDITTVNIVSPDLDVPYQAYYCYLLGRGKEVLYAPNSQPHNTGSLGAASTGAVADTYIANLEVIKNSIKLRDSQGALIDINDYPYDIYLSPYNVSAYTEAINSSVNLNLAGLSLTGSASNYLLDDHYFSVILLTNKKTIADNTSVWAHYTSYNTTTKELNTSHKEIVNPIPIFRQNQLYESPVIGRYSISRDPDSDNYNVVIYGIESGLSGSI